MSRGWLLAQEGPRDRYSRVDGDGFGDIELLALVLGTGTAQRSARAIATDLVDTFGGPAGIAASPVLALGKIHGLGQARAVRVHAACRLSRRSSRPGGQRVLTTQDAWKVFRCELEGLLHEELHAAYLDTDNRVQLYRRVCVGTARFTFVDPPRILGPAAAISSAAVLVAHNHPGGNPEPSGADLESTRRLALAAKAVGIPLLDHLVIGDGRYVSLAERGVLAAWGEPQASTTG